MRKHRPPFTILISSLPKGPRRRLYREYRRRGSFQAVAAAHQVNVRYVFDFIRHGIVPKNVYACKALGIPRAKQPHPVSVNQLLQLPIQEQPPEILRLALENREDYFPEENSNDTR